MQHHTDEHLNHWADIYVARNVRKHGISLEVFLQYPREVLARIDRIEKAEGNESEPHQHRCDRRDVATFRQRGTQLIQKLWHGNRKRLRSDMPVDAQGRR